MAGKPLCNLRYFQKLCEDELDRVILTTTMWDSSEVDEVTGSRREKELKDIYWKSLLDRGSSVKRFLNDRASAIKILEPIVQRAQASSQRNAPQNTVDRVSTIVQFLNEYAVGPMERLHERAATVMADIWQSRLPPRIFM